MSTESLPPGSIPEQPQASGQTPEQLAVERDDQGIVAANLRMLNEDMQQFLCGESIGGNAGSEIINGEEYPCAGGNGFAHQETGRIVAFSNNPNDPEAKKGNVWFLLRVAANLGPEAKKTFFKILKLYHNPGEESISERGIKNMQTAIEKFNKENK